MPPLFGQLTTLQFRAQFANTIYMKRLGQGWHQSAQVHSVLETTYNTLDWHGLSTCFLSPSDLHTQFLRSTLNLTPKGLVGYQFCIQLMHWYKFINTHLVAIYRSSQPKFKAVGLFSFLCLHARQYCLTALLSGDLIGERKKARQTNESI